MLLRGQNLLGYRHYEDTVVDRFVDKSAENGMDVFRVFDALNDIRNLAPRHRRPSAATGKHAQGTICYTVSPLHTVDELRRDGRAAAGPGLRFASASRTWPRCSSRSRPTTSSRPSRTTCGEDVRVHVHVHATTGVTLVSLMKAIEAGADCVDTAISSLSLGPGHNPTESLVEMLEGTGYTHRARQGAAAARSRSTSPRSGRATPSSSPTSPASRPRSSTARFPAA